MAKLGDEQVDVEEPIPAGLEMLVRQRDELRRVVNALDDVALADLYRRAEESASDGFGAGRSETGGTGSEVANPVLALVERAAGGRPEKRHPETGELLAEATPDTWDQQADPVRDMISTIFEHLGHAVHHALAIGRYRKRLDRVSGHERRSALQGECKCCGRGVAGTPNDRLRSSYCEPCYRAWVDAGRPGSDPQEPGNARARWEEERRAFLRSGDGRSRRSRAS